MLDQEYNQNYKKVIGVSLSQKEFEEMIKEYIVFKFPTYYRINSLINVLSGQLKKISLNFQFSAENLIQNGNMLGKQNSKNIRAIMVNALLKYSTFYTRCIQ